MPDVIIVQTNPVRDLVVLPYPQPSESDLVYTGGGGLFWSALQDDFVSGGYQWHSGNPLISEDLQLKACDKIRVLNETNRVFSGQITRGLFSVQQNQAGDDEYFWDEVYTSPLGQYEAILIASSLNQYEFQITNDDSEELYISTHDINIIPKEGDYIFIQKARDVINNSHYTDGFSNFPVITNAEIFQFKLLEVSIDTINGADTIYKLVLDKSFKPIIGDKYNIVLLNRENTSIQKELFYDTFEQIEVHKEQLLGDPYDNTLNSNIPAGRKNHLNYNSAQYLGLKTLLNGIINDTLTPFIVYDITNDIKDKFKIENESFTFVLPFVMIQDDTRTIMTASIDEVNKLKNKGTIYNADKNIGKYSGLYFDWDTSLTKRYGWIFYDLRIIVIDDSELATALSYNANRNYTLPAPVLSTNFGNKLKNPGGSLDLQITDLTDTTPIIITTEAPHNLQEGTGIFIKEAKVTDINGNVLTSNANGFHYIKLVYPNGITQPHDPNKLSLWDASLTVPVIGNGTYVANTGRILGIMPEYSYFFTYRLIGEHYSSIAPYSKTTDFNFAKNGVVDDSGTAQLKFSIDTLKFLQDNTVTTGYQATDLEIIIGKYVNSNPVEPNEVTGFEEMVVIPITELNFSRNLFSLGNQATLTDIIVTKDDYDTFVSLIGGSGPYDKVGNPTGDPSYNIVSNYEHYNYVSDPVPDDLVTGKGKWTLGNLTYQQEVEQYRTTIEVVVPAGAWNDTTNPTYNPENPFINDRFISEVGLVIEEDGVERPMIYAKIAPAIRKNNILDIILSMSIDW